MLVFCSPQIGWRRYQLVSDSLQKFLLVGINQRLSEQRHEVICHDNEISTCFSRPEVVCHKIIDGEIILQFLYPILRIRPSAIWVTYDLGRQVKVCYKAAVSVFSKIFLILKKIQLLDLLSCSFGAFLDFLLRKRAIIETINDELKNIAQVEHSRHRSFDNFIVNTLGALAAYCFFPKKPTIAVQRTIDRHLTLF